MAQTRASTVGIDRLRNPNTLIVSPPMLNTLEHRTNKLSPDQDQQFPAIPHIFLCCFVCAFCGSDFKRAALAERVEHAEGGTRRRCQFIEIDRKRVACKHARANLSHLLPVDLCPAPST